MYPIDPQWLTSEVVAICRGMRATGDYSAAPILADAIQDAGCENENILLAMRRQVYAYRETIDAIADGTTGPEWERSETERLAREAAERKRKRDAVCLFRVGVTGNPYSLKELQTRITRRRPRGSGSRVELAQRLADRMDALAARRWARATKGQRKPSEKQVAEMIAAIEAAVESSQTRARERRIGVADVIRAARKADANGHGYVDGGTVTANSYGYRWETSTARSERLADGTIRVRVSRGSSVDLTFPARWWVTLSAE